MLLSEISGAQAIQAEVNSIVMRLVRSVPSDSISEWCMSDNDSYHAVLLRPSSTKFVKFTEAWKKLYSQIKDEVGLIASVSEPVIEEKGDRVIFDVVVRHDD